MRRSCFVFYSLLSLSSAAFGPEHRNREVVLCEDAVHGGLDWYDSTTKATKASTCRKDVARIQFANKINETGWAMADISIVDASAPDYLQGYAAGFVEGAASRDLIDMYHYNLLDGYCDGAEAYCKRLQTFAEENLAWMRQYIAKYPNDPYWRQVNMTIAHVIGMIDGYEGTLFSGRADHETIAHKIYMLQLDSEADDMEGVLGRPAEVRRRRDHCSAIVKVTPGNQNLFFAHNTWDTYASMLRVQRRISFQLKDLPGRTYTMSSDPGTLPSGDDFMLSSANVAIMETTNAVYDETLYKQVSSHAVMTWIRCQVATRMAASAADWTSIFSRFNSGTYNNQWMVVDYNLFTPGMSTLPKGLLYVLEQLPGTIEIEDMTERLQTDRYWASYNVPYFSRIFQMGGYLQLVEKYGSYFSWNETARARIFRRDHAAAVDIDSMRKLMRYNNFSTDPLSMHEGCTPRGNAVLSLAARGDLNPYKGSCPISELNANDDVATDYKVDIWEFDLSDMITDVNLMKTLSFDSEAGPTHQDLPPFDWSTAHLNEKVRHVGHPTVFNFSPIRHIWGVDPVF